MGNPTIIIRTPEKKAVSRQPNVVSDHATAGTSSPPIPKPLMAIPIATPRRLSNQLTTVVATVRNPATLEAQGHEGKGEVVVQDGIRQAEHYEPRAKQHHANSHHDPGAKTCR